MSLKPKQHGRAPPETDVDLAATLIPMPGRELQTGSSPWRQLHYVGQDERVIIIAGGLEVRLAPGKPVMVPAETARAWLEDHPTLFLEVA